MVVRNFKEAHAALRPLYDNARTKYDLTLIRQLMDYLGNPQDRLRAVHVAGTSGKTSTAYYAAALLRAAGYTTGLTVSPHVDEVNERVQVNLQPLPEKEFCRELTGFLELIAKSKLQPSYFEAMTAFAYHTFAKRQVDYAVIEVGLGGLLDGTNVITRSDKVCIITDIGLDHTEILGETLPEIAAQKAGIILPGNQVFMYEQPPEVVEVVRKVSSRQGAVLHVLPTEAAVADPALPLFQQHNLGLAVQAVDFVARRDGKAALSDAQVRTAAGTRIPARMERFQLDGKVLLVDGGHNAQKLTALAESIRAAYPHEPVAALVAFVAGNDGRWQAGAEVLARLSSRIIVTGFQTEQDVPKQSVDPERVAAYLREKGVDEVAVEPSAALAWEYLRTVPERVLLVAGSFYLLNSIRPLILEG